MKKLGIIGGAGPLASALLYETLIKECYRTGKAIPEILLLNYPFTKGLTPQEAHLHGELLEGELHQAIKTLEQNGVEMGIVACNTLHHYLSSASVLPFPFLLIPQAVLQAALQGGSRRLFIVGTQNTCAHHLYKHSYIESVYPTQKEQLLIDQIIDHLLEGRVRGDDALFLAELIEQKEGCDGVVLGCTELPVLHHHFPLQSKIPIYDSIKIPSQTLIRGLS